MIYSINPQVNTFPPIVSGDIWVIYGREYPVRGIVSDKRQMNQVGVYGLQQNNNLTIHLVHPQSEEDLIQAFQAPVIDRIEKLLAMNPVDTTKDYVFEVFTPPILDNDNYLKIIIKKLLVVMQVDIRDYRPLFKNDNHFNNMRRLLTSDANLTYEKFVEWLDILGFGHNLTIFDKNGMPVDLSNIQVPNFVEA